MTKAEQQLKRYVELWGKQIIAGADPDGPVMKEVLSAYSADARYLDVPSRAAWEGREAIGQMFVISYTFSNDYEIDVQRMFTDGRFFAIEGEATGSNHTTIGEYGRRAVVPFGSIGWFDDEGLVREHHDHWDRKGWLVQIGAEEPHHWLNESEDWRGADVRAEPGLHT
jgi:hypothetical protein